MKKHLFKGFGGALTESSSYVFSFLDEIEREKVLSAFFDKDNPIYDSLRVPIDSSDFSLSPHSGCHTIDD